MNVLVSTYSIFGHTKLLGQTIADAIAEYLDDSGHAIAISMHDNVVSTLADMDLVIKGSLTHNMELPREVGAVLDALPKRWCRGVRITVFDTPYRMNALLMRFTAARKLDRKLRKLGGKRVIPPETFYVVEGESPREEGEVQWAQARTAQIRSKR